MNKLPNHKAEEHPTYGLVSIVTPVYNSEPFLPKYFEGILVQDYPDIELILVDDGSTDNSKRVMEREKKALEARGINVIILNQSNSGAAAAVKAGLQIASGDFLVWPDSDDILLPGSISKRVDAIVNSGCEVVISDSYLSNDSLGYQPTGIKFIPKPSNNRLERVLLAINRSFPVQSAGIMVRMRAVKRLKIIENLYISREGQNYQIYIPLLYFCDCFKLNQVLQVILVSSSSHSRRRRSFFELLSRQKEINKIINMTISSMYEVDPADAKTFFEFNSKQYRWRVLSVVLSKLYLGRLYSPLSELFFRR